MHMRQITNVMQYMFARNAIPELRIVVRNQCERLRMQTIITRVLQFMSARNVDPELHLAVTDDCERSWMQVM